MKSKAQKYGLPLASYVKNLVINDVKDVDIPVFKMSAKREKVTLYQIHFLDANLPVYIIQNKKYLNIPNNDIFPFFNLAVLPALWIARIAEGIGS